MWDETISYTCWRTQQRSWRPFCGSDRVPFQQKGGNLKLSEIKELIFRNLCLFRQTLLWPEIQPTFHFLSYIFNWIWHHNHFSPNCYIVFWGNLALPPRIHLHSRRLETEIRSPTHNCFSCSGSCLRMWTIFLNSILYIDETSYSDSIITV